MGGISGHGSTIFTIFGYQFFCLAALLGAPTFTLPSSFVHHDQGASLAQAQAQVAHEGQAYTLSLSKGKTEDLDKVHLAIGQLSRHHSASNLPTAALRLLRIGPGTMSNTHKQPWKCICGRLNKSSASYCGTCAKPWWEVPPTPPGRPGGRRGDRSPSPRGGRHKNKNRDKDGQLPAAPTSDPPVLGPQWPALPSQAKGATRQPPKPAGKGKPAAPPSATSMEMEAQLRNLLTSMRQHFLGELPDTLQEAVQNLEACKHRQVTKELHAHTTTVGSSQQTLAELRSLRVAHQRVWGDYLKSTLRTLRQQAKEYASKMHGIQEQEKACEEKLQRAKASIAQISAGLDKPVEPPTEPEPAQEEFAAVDLEALQKGVEDVISRYLPQPIKREDPDTPRPKGAKRSKEREGEAGAMPASLDVEVCSSDSSPRGPN